MTVPALNVARQGLSQISSDNYNTYLQDCNIVTDLRAFIGVAGMQVYMRGFTSIGDGGQGMFYWNASGVATDDGGVTTITPNGSAAGQWARINFVMVDSYAYIVPINGFSTTIPNYTNALILDPAGALSTGTVIMPALCLDGQFVSISSSQTISTLTVSVGAGQGIFGTPATITSTAPVKFIYRLANKTFYRGG